MGTSALSDPGRRQAPLAGCPADSVGSWGWRVEVWRLQPPVIQLLMVFQALVMLIESSPRVTATFLSFCFLLPFATQKGLELLSLSCWCLVTTVSLSCWLSEGRFLALGALLGGRVFPAAFSFNYISSVCLSVCMCKKRVRSSPRLMFRYSVIG